MPSCHFKYSRYGPQAWKVTTTGPPVARNVTSVLLFNALWQMSLTSGIAATRNSSLDCKLTLKLFLVSDAYAKRGELAKHVRVLQRHD